MLYVVHLQCVRKTFYNVLLYYTLTNQKQTALTSKSVNNKTARICGVRQPIAVEARSVIKIYNHIHPRHKHLLCRNKCHLSEYLSDTLS